MIFFINGKVYASCYTSMLMLILGFYCAGLYAQQTNNSAIESSPVAIPKIFQHAIKYQQNKLVLADPEGDDIYPLRAEEPKYSLSQFSFAVTGTKQGLSFNFGNINGRLYYGLIDTANNPHALPVYFKKSLAITNGLVAVNIKQLSGKYDLSSWQKSGQGELGYRVLNELGEIIFDGQVAFIEHANGFNENLGFIKTPSVHNITNNSAVIAFESNFPATAIIRLNGHIVAEADLSRNHEILLENLTAAQSYQYQVEIKAQKPGSKLSYHNQSHSSFTTAEQPGARKPFIFAYASDSRKGQGSGERNIYGVNAYIMKKIMAVTLANKAKFLQFSGDMIDGRSNSIDEQRLQYRNWQHSIAPFTKQLPVYATMGNHEGLFHTFDDGSDVGINVDKFPFASESAEAVFAAEFVMPENGPISEDGASYDPDLTHNGDFPPYKETVYAYQYDNIAMVVLNSNYLFSQSYKYWFAKQGKAGSPLPGGGLHGYIMEQQLLWLAATLDKYQQDPNIDHIFVSQHTPLFPNGGHKSDDMWYEGSNIPRPSISGQAVASGIIEQRNKLLSLFNKHSKVFALLTGDEHNYARTLITPDSIIHNKKYQPAKNPLTRSLWQINNGAAGAPYYAQQKLPWSDGVLKFSTQHAVVLFHINGKQVQLEVIDPDTLARVE